MYGPEPAVDNMLCESLRRASLGSIWSSWRGASLAEDLGLRRGAEEREVVEPEVRALYFLESEKEGMVSE